MHMASQLPPSPLVYDSDPPGAAEYYSPYDEREVYQSPDGLYYYARHEQPSTSSYTGAHEAGAIAVVSNQEPTSHQFYGDAAAAVISYPNAYPGQSGDAWVQAKSVQSQNFYPGSARRQAVYCDSGEASPASDDSNAAFYDSPTSQGSNLADDYTVHSRSGSQIYYSQPLAIHPTQECMLENDVYTRRRTGSDDCAEYEENALHFSGAPHSQYAARQNYPAAYYAEPTSVDDGYNASQVYIDNVASAGLAERCSPTYFIDAPFPQTPEQGQSVRAPARAESPMGHLPYHHDANYQQLPQAHASLPYYPSANSSPFTHAPQATRPILSVQQPQPHYPQQQPTPPTPISIPSHSPPLIEDTPKKPLTLACFFCRKRKIACGSPPPGSQDRTCNQCARRKLQCVYPAGTRRSVRQRDVSVHVAPASGPHHIPRA